MRVRASVPQVLQPQPPRLRFQRRQRLRETALIIQYAGAQALATIDGVRESFRRLAQPLQLTGPPVSRQDYRGARKAYEAAIKTLDRLADEAAAVGDVARQAWAQADAAYVLTLYCSSWARRNALCGPEELKQRLAKLRRVLASPYLPDKLRADIIEQRCGGVCRLERLSTD